MRNQEIRQAAVVNGVRFWQIAEVLGVHENTLSRRFRAELPQKEKEEILNIIERLSKEEH